MSIRRASPPPLLLLWLPLTSSDRRWHSFPPFPVGVASDCFQRRRACLSVALAAQQHPGGRETCQPATPACAILFDGRRLPTLFHHHSVEVGHTSSRTTVTYCGFQQRGHLWISRSIRLHLWPSREDPTHPTLRLPILCHYHSVGVGGWGGLDPSSARGECASVTRVATYMQQQ